MHVINELPDVPSAQSAAPKNIEERHNLSHEDVSLQDVAEFATESNTFGAGQKSANAEPVDSVAQQQALRAEWER